MLAVKIAGYYRHFNHQKHHYLLLPVLFLIAYLSIYFHKQPMFDGRLLIKIKKDVRQMNNTRQKIALIAPKTGLEDFLKKYGVSEIVHTEKNPYLQQFLAYHPDMNISFIGRDDALLHSSQQSMAKMLKTRAKGLSVHISDQPDRPDYPFDIALNAVTFGKKIFGYKNRLSLQISVLAKSKGYEIIDCKQGYTHCSILKISETAAITGDKGLYNKLMSNGIDALQVNNSEIKLEGYSYGFIGGCGLMITEHTLALNGSLKKCSFGNEMQAFCKKHGVEIAEASENQLTDIGGGFILTV